MGFGTINSLSKGLTLCGKKTVLNNYAAHKLSLEEFIVDHFYGLIKMYLLSLITTAPGN